ncbi:MAG: hypothetical protein FRX49_05280 [Trebouxia sp. A1-2]|nr:MAG: hypothetical protein FRX49_05280 [Trebouxia sp. A1-2]
MVGVRLTRRQMSQSMYEANSNHPWRSISGGMPERGVPGAGQQGPSDEGCAAQPKAPDAPAIARAPPLHAAHPCAASHSHKLLNEKFSSNISWTATRSVTGSSANNCPKLDNGTLEEGHSKILPGHALNNTKQQQQHMNGLRVEPKYQFAAQNMKLQAMHKYMSGVTQRVGGILKGWDEPEHAATLLPPIHHLPPCPCTHCQRETNAAAADAEGEVGRAVKETSTKAECNSMGHMQMGKSADLVMPCNEKFTLAKKERNQSFVV